MLKNSIFFEGVFVSIQQNDAGFQTAKKSAHVALHSGGNAQVGEVLEGCDDNYRRHAAQHH